MVSWQTIQSLLIFFGPLLLPRALAFYRSLRTPPTAPIPLPTSTSRALNLLFISALLALLSTLPSLAPANIFPATQSRLQAPTSVLFTRLSALRPLTALDEHLKRAFEAADEGRHGLDLRLLYLQFGPEVVARNPLTAPGTVDWDKGKYAYYALPQLLMPHLAHLVVLGLATSAGLAGAAAGRWRTFAAVAGLAVAVADLWLRLGYDAGGNAAAARVAEIESFWWKARVYRGLAVALLDAVLGWMVYLTATRRAFVQPPPASQRIEASARRLEKVLGQVRVLGTLRNAIFRDRGMRERVNGYWTQESQMMNSMCEDREVVDAMNAVLGRIDMGNVQRGVDAYVDGVFGGGGEVRTQ